MLFVLLENLREVDSSSKPIKIRIVQDCPHGGDPEILLPAYHLQLVGKQLRDARTLILLATLRI